MLAHLNLPHLHIQTTAQEEDLGLATLDSASQSIQSGVSGRLLVAERPPQGAHILIPTKYPLVIRAMSQMDRGTEWVVVKQPVERVGVGLDVIAASERDGLWVGPVVMAGEVRRVVRYERKYVVYEVQGITGQEWELGVRYSDSMEGWWKRLCVFLFNYTDHHAGVDGKEGVWRVLDYFWGSCARV